MEFLYVLLLFAAFVFAMASAVTYKIVKSTHRGVKRLIGK